MQEKIYEVEKKLTMLQKEVELLKENYGRLEIIEKEVHQIKNLVTKMEMIDNNIFDRLDVIANGIAKHKEKFDKHDEKEMEKYSTIDKRLVKIEKLIWMAVGAFAVVELMHKYKMISFGG